MIEYLRFLYRKEQFNPGVIGPLINPFYFARKGLYRHISNLIANLDGRLLDVGCGTKPYQGISVASDYVGLEIHDDGNRLHKYADVLYDGEMMPFEDKCFDSLLLNQVFEHVFNPNRFLREVNRVLKKDADILITIPFVWDEHEQPYDYARYTSPCVRIVVR